MSSIDITEELFSETQKNNTVRNSKTMDWLDKNGISLFMTENGNYFLFQTRASGFPKGVPEMPNYVRETICALMDIKPQMLADDSLFIEAEYISNKARVIMCDYEYRSHKYQETTGKCEIIKRIGYVSDADKAASEIDRRIDEFSKKIEKQHQSVR